MLRTLVALWKSRKGELPGWTYVIALIIGLFFLLFAIYLIAKSGQKQAGWLDWLR